MSRSSITRWWLFLLSALTAALGLLPAQRGQAATYTYSARQRTINAGVLFVGSAGDTTAAAPDPAPYVFYVLDQRADAKPVGWKFINPQAPTLATTQSARRWGYPLTPVTAITPGLAAYWEVPLRDVSYDQLQQYDVLYLPASAVSFTPGDNEKLRRFVDNGGLLLVEYGAAGGSNPLFTGTDWVTGSNSPLNAPTPLAGVYDLHPLLTQPNLLPLITQPYLFPAGGFPDLGAPAPSTVYGTLTALAGSDYFNLFGTVLSHSGGPALTAAQLGAGQIVTTALNLGPKISISQGAYFGIAPFFSSYTVTPPPPSFSPTVVPSTDLQLLANAISWGDTHSTENKSSHQNAAGPSSASFAPAWAVPVSGNNAAPGGAAVWGNYVYVTDAAGILHAFDAYPGEGITGEAKTDSGKSDFSSAAPTAYDEVWNASIGAGASAPTVGSFNNQTYVFVERADGSVIQFNSVNIGTAAPVKTLTPPAPANGPAGSYPQPGVNNAPAPTLYDGRIYAGQPNGDLYVYSLNGVGSAGVNAGVNGVRLPVNPAGIGTAEYVTAPPAVGLLAAGATTNTVVAYLSTNQHLYTVLLGARNDPLIAYNVNGSIAGYNVSRTARYNVAGLVVDVNSLPAARAYDLYGNFLANAAGQGQDPVFPTTNVGTYYADWDADLGRSVTNGLNLTMHGIKATSYASTNNSATLSAPAIDRKGDYYYTANDGTNSYLIGVHPDLAQSRVRLKFRFRLPIQGDSSTIDPISGTQWSDNPIDADNVNYTPLMGFKFVGTPVVDSQGSVYAASQNGSIAAVLCFNANGEITAAPLAIPANFDATQATFFQLDENNPSQQNPLQTGGRVGGNGNTFGAQFGEVTTSTNLVTVFNFGRNSPSAREIAGNLTEPQPFTASPSQNAQWSATWMYFHTNMAWYTTFPVNGTISGLSLAGSKLLLTDSSGASNAYNTLYKLPVSPTVGAGKVASVTPLRTSLGPGTAGQPGLNIGTVAAAPSAGGGAMVINGSTGIAAFNQQLALIADNNRVLQADADGNAVWSADATTRDVTDAAGKVIATTKVDFSHPTALAEVAPNDYLAADTGNNRCVRFDHAGKVLWELTRFNDPVGLMAPGQPPALSQPTSVEVRLEPFNYTDPVSGNAMTGKAYHYLVADSGNDRIVEVTDVVDSSGRVLSTDPGTGAVVATGTANSIYQDHVLSWVTHTGDQFGRRYRYISASYLYLSSTVKEVVALVANTRIAPLTPQSTLRPVSGDTSGGSIVTFDRTLPVAKFATTLPNDMNYVATTFSTPNGPFAIRSPRYLKVFVAQNAPQNPPQFSFLYADDNGAFDLNYIQNQPLAATKLAFTQQSYKAMILPVGGIPATTYDRTRLPFVPTCVQRLNSDNTLFPRYLITQSFSQGELGGPFPVTVQPRIGGEIFEVDVDSSNVNAPPIITPVGGFGGGLGAAGLTGFTLSRPGDTSPLTQPTFAVRTPQ